MLCLNGFELYSRWVPLEHVLGFLRIRRFRQVYAKLDASKHWMSSCLKYFKFTD